MLFVVCRVEVDQAGLLQLLAHIVHIEPEHTFRELLALAFLVRLTLLAFRDDFCSVLPGLMETFAKRAKVGLNPIIRPGFAPLRLCRRPMNSD